MLEEILRLDQFDNATHEPRPGGDGRPDFESERFVFLADQANMPYGNYAAAGKRSCLVDLAVNDAVFLLDNRYYRDPRAASPSRDKPPVKAVVIACNTATAYAKRDIESLIARARIDVKVIDVIDAGARGAVDAIAAARGGTVGVIATQGTCDSGAYPAAIDAIARQRGLGPVRVVQQGSVGLAGAIDGLSDFILPGVSSRRPRSDYRGPSLANPLARIDAAILARYAFDFSGGRMLWEGSPDRPAVLQINSVENYVAYEVVTLLEKLRADPPPRPLTTVVLGCTHFPYHGDAFRAQLRRLYDYEENGRYVYRGLMAAEVLLIDPAAVTARQLYLTAKRGQNYFLPPRAAEAQGDRPRKIVLTPFSEFYVTVPNPSHPGVRLDAAGGFTYDYKYGRTEALGGADVRVVPLTVHSLPPLTARRLEHQLPAVWGLLRDFSDRTGKRDVAEPPARP